MIQLLEGGAYLVDGKQVIAADSEAPDRLQAAAGVSPSPEEAKKKYDGLWNSGGTQYFRKHG